MRKYPQEYSNRNKNAYTCKSIYWCLNLKNINVDGEVDKIIVNRGYHERIKKSICEIMLQYE